MHKSVPRMEGRLQDDQYFCAVFVRPPGPDDPGIDLSETPAICRGCVDEGAGCLTAQVAECYRREEADAAYGDPAYEELNAPAERCA